MLKFPLDSGKGTNLLDPTLIQRASGAEVVVGKRKRGKIGRPTENEKDNVGRGPKKGKTAHQK